MGSSAGDADGDPRAEVRDLCDAVPVHPGEFVARRFRHDRAQIARGLALVFSGAKPIYFNDTPNYKYISPESSITSLIPGLEIPNGVLVMFGLAAVGTFLMSRRR